MIDITLHVDIPAMDRLAKVLEGRLIAPAATPAPEPLQEPQKQPQEAPAPEPREEHQEEPKPAPEPAEAPAEGPTFTLDQVQRAAAQLRDQGKLKAVTDMFPEFEIKKLSDLKDDKLQAFGARLKGLGAAL